MKIANRKFATQPLKTPIPVTMEQFECPICKKKFYINKEDQNGSLKCPFCENDTQNIREFDVSILAIGEI